MVAIPGGGDNISGMALALGVMSAYAKRLRTGEGEPFRQETRQELIMRFAVQTVKGSNEFRKALVAMLATLDDSEWDGLEKLLDKMLEQYKKD